MRNTCSEINAGGDDQTFVALRSGKITRFGRLGLGPTSTKKGRNRTDMGHLRQRMVHAPIRRIPLAVITTPRQIISSICCFVFSQVALQGLWGGGCFGRRFVQHLFRHPPCVVNMSVADAEARDAKAGTSHLGPQSVARARRAARRTRSAAGVGESSAFPCAFEGMHCVASSSFRNEARAGFRDTARCAEFRRWGRCQGPPKSPETSPVSGMCTTRRKLGRRG